MLFLMASCMRRSTRILLLDTLFLMVTSVISVALSMASSRLPTPGLSASPLLFSLLVLLLASMILLSLFILHLEVAPLFFSMWMICLSQVMILIILSLLKPVFASSFTCLTWALLATFLGLRPLLLLRGIISPSESTFRISLTVRALLITVLWTLPWSSTSVSVPLTVFLLRILLAIAILLAALSISASLVLIYPMAFTFLVIL